MRLTALCISCQRENEIRSAAKTRGELEMERGREITITCDYCAILNKKHINRITAEVDNTIIIGGVILSIILTVGLLMFFGWISLFALVLPITIRRWEMNKAHTFNSYRVRN